MSGVRLPLLESCDMMDVLHYMFEQDLDSSTAEQAEAKSKIRENIYDLFYERRYKYGLSSKSDKQFDLDSDPGFVNNPESGIIPVNPSERAKEVGSAMPAAKKNPTNLKKRYIPPTQFDEDSEVPFGKLLDPPMN